MTQDNEVEMPGLGERLRLAREACGLTQASAASEIEVARTTLVAMEKDQRRVRLSELQELAQLYRTSVNALLRRSAVHVDLVPRFRRTHSSPDADSEEAASLLGDLVRAEVELEDVLGIARPRSYPPERPLLPGDVTQQAESDAAELRQWLGLGSAPVRDLISVLEIDLGVRVYVRPLPARVAGAFAFEESVGACILLNASHPRERRTQTAAHETGHLVGTRQQPDVLLADQRVQSREERYCDSFGRSLLTPARAVRQRFQEVTAGADRLTRRHVIILAHAFGVSREAMVRRLEELGLTKRGTWDWFVDNGSITDAQVAQVLGDLGIEPNNGARDHRPASLRLNLLAAEAWRRELMTEGQLATLLKIDRLAVREELDSLVSHEGDANEYPKLPQ